MITNIIHGWKKWLFSERGDSSWSPVVHLNPSFEHILSCQSHRGYIGNSLIHNLPQSTFKYINVFVFHDINIFLLKIETIHDRIIAIHLFIIFLPIALSHWSQNLCNPVLSSKLVDILNWILAQIDPLQLLHCYMVALLNCEWPCFYLRPDSAVMICVTDATFTDFFPRIMTLRWASGRAGICNDQSQRCLLAKGGGSALERAKRNKMKREREMGKWLPIEIRRISCLDEWCIVNHIGTGRFVSLTCHGAMFFVAFVFFSHWIVAFWALCEYFTCLICKKLNVKQLQWCITDSGVNQV